MTMHSQDVPALDLVPSDITIKQELNHSEASSIYKAELFGKTIVLKLGTLKKGRDLNRFRCELKAYENLHKFGVCNRGFVPTIYGYVDRLDPFAFRPPLQHFSKDQLRPRAILLENLLYAESLNCVNYSQDLVRCAIQGLQEIHNAFIHHRDIYPKNIIVSGGKIIRIDFDVAITFGNMSPHEKAYCEYEIELVKSFGKLLARPFSFL
ncbi:uncharacterized protein N7477_007972 [Penicillium maclennaniae]|uniref:uncharacterized protein n=1 Tax=Penicillium maclennaniae TaxID=1343394 RepID=UPI0025404543|nr:uncharacterized protein N7477_007972 [Penicillium maclennaniae]KAJ5665524.1 hypothetical protein N7477_007972 [Penicillium maclennaniae]